MDYINNELQRIYREISSLKITDPGESKNWANNTLAGMIMTAMGRKLIYDRSIGSFWIWNKIGFYMPIVNDDDLRKMVAIFLETWQIRGITMGKIDDVLAQIRIRVDAVNDLEEEWISFTDCIWSPITQETEKSSSEKIATVHIPIKFKDTLKAEAPKLKKYLKETCITEDGNFDQEMVDQLQEFAGYLLWPSLEKCPCVFFYGEGSNGKSVYIDILRGLLGKCRTASCGLEQLIGDRFGMANLVGVRFNASDEMGNCREATTASFKKMIVGDPISIQKKFKDSFEFIPKCKFIFCTNIVPAFKETNIAMRRRLLIIPFFRTLDPFTPKGREKIITGLGNLIIKEELPGVVHWAMEGLEKLKKQDFWMTRSKASEEMMTKFENESSSVIEFLDEFFEYDPSQEHAIRSDSVYSDYVTWCKDVGRKQVARITFGRDFKERFGKSFVKKIEGKSYRVFNCRRKDEKVGHRHASDPFASLVGQTQDHLPDF